MRKLGRRPLKLREWPHVKIGAMTQPRPTPPRTPWRGLTDVLIHASESAVKQHPAYKAAKSGNGGAALALVGETMNDLQNHRLVDLLQARRPTLVSAHAYEKEGVNAIPEILADELSKVLGWPVDSGVFQTNVVGHTGADGFARLARQARFAGEVEAGCEYVMVDDFVGMGGTLANLKGYLESKGGQVVAAVALTGKPHSAKLTPTIETLNELRARHGTELEGWWIQRFGHAFDALTESEARYLARTPGADTIRGRIAAVE